MWETAWLSNARTTAFTFKNILQYIALDAGSLCANVWFELNEIKQNSNQGFFPNSPLFDCKQKTPIHGN